MWYNHSGKGRKDLVAQESRGMVSGTLSGEHWIDSGMAVVRGVLAATTMPAADLMETSKLGWSLEWGGAEPGAPTRQNRRSRRWPT